MPRPNRSADRIVDALIELMTKRSYSDVTISDITAAADVSRICFYRNFKSKEEVLDRFIARVVEEIEHNLVAADVTDLKGYFYVLFSTVARYSSVVMEICHANLCDTMLTYFNRKLFISPIRDNYLELDRYRRRFYTGAFYNVLIEWIMTGMRESAESMAEMCSGLIA